ESGDDVVLERVCKGATSAQMIEASNMVKAAGIELSQYVLLGIGGKKDWERHAKNTAKVLNAMNPDFIRVRTLVVREDAPLYEDAKNGIFNVCTPDEVLDETRIILENLDVTSRFCSDHISNYANLNGKLPDDQEQLLSELKTTRERLEQDAEFRAWLTDPMRCLNL
ncbi:MAG: radical SAM protein, partial [Thermoplasmata archaeon]|nr:radical SAM protein [Thermoplasmata archaeon]